MKIGIVYPQTELGSDPLVIRDYAQAAESLGFDHIEVYDHVVGANPNRLGPNPPYTYQSAFQEPFVLFGYMASVTQRIEFCTGIVILPQRQTALVAKQAATVDVLSGGRLRLGVAIGWNPMEFVALNRDFHTRARLMEEQIEVLRRLWTEPLVTFTGKWHTIPDAGLNPLPVRPIPLWLGGYVDAAVRRAARLADGWIIGYNTAAETRPWMARLDRYLAEAGRSREDFGVEGVVHYGRSTPEACRALVAEWQSLGCTHFSFDLMRKGIATPAEHFSAIEEIAKALSLS